MKIENQKLIRCAAEIVEDFIPACRLDGDMSVGVRDTKNLREGEIYGIGKSKTYFSQY